MVATSFFNQSFHLNYLLTSYKIEYENKEIINAIAILLLREDDRVKKEEILSSNF